MPQFPMVQDASLIVKQLTDSVKLLQEEVHKPSSLTGTKRMTTQALLLSRKVVNTYKAP